jgi:uncharacterized protein (UPF0332 family)
MNPLMVKALRAAKSARRLEAAEDYEGACDRAYYAIFNAIRTLLEADGVVKPDEVKTHSSTLRIFSETFFRAGRVDKALVSAVYFAQDLRARADYSRAYSTAEEARKAIDTMDQLLGFVTAHLNDRKDSP